MKRLKIKLNVWAPPHDLQRYSASYASRNGFQLEVASEVILRHQDLKTTQVYLGKISDSKRFVGWTSCMENRSTNHNQLKQRGLWGNKIVAVLVVTIFHEKIRYVASSSSIRRFWRAYSLFK